MEISQNVHTLPQLLIVPINSTIIIEESTGILHDLRHLIIPTSEISMLLPSGTLIRNILIMNVNEGIHF